ncbi:cathepsin L [Ranunculus cassubicifolius]
MAAKYFIPTCIFLVGFLACHVSSSRSLPEEASMQAKHEKWMSVHARLYTTTAEKEKRLKIFRENVEKIEAWNRNEKHSYKLSINKFADQTNEEFRATRTAKNMESFKPKSLGTSPFRYENFTGGATSHDWRKKGAVTPVKDQGNCGKKLLYSSPFDIQNLKSFLLILIMKYLLLNCRMLLGVLRCCSSRRT